MRAIFACLVYTLALAPLAPAYAQFGGQVREQLGEASSAPPIALPIAQGPVSFGDAAIERAVSADREAERRAALERLQAMPAAAVLLEPPPLPLPAPDDPADCLARRDIACLAQDVRAAAAAISDAGQRDGLLYALLTRDIAVSPPGTLLPDRLMTARLIDDKRLVLGVLAWLLPPDQATWPQLPVDAQPRALLAGLSGQPVPPGLGIRGEDGALVQSLWSAWPPTVRQQWRDDLVRVQARTCPGWTLPPADGEEAVTLAARQAEAERRLLCTPFSVPRALALAEEIGKGEQLAAFRSALAARLIAVAAAHSGARIPPDAVGELAVALLPSIGVPGQKIAALAALVRAGIGPADPWLDLADQTWRTAPPLDLGRSDLDGLVLALIQRGAVDRLPRLLAEGGPAAPISRDMRARLALFLALSGAAGIDDPAKFAAALDQFSSSMPIAGDAASQVNALLDVADWLDGLGRPQLAQLAEQHAGRLALATFSAPARAAAMLRLIQRFQGVRSDAREAGEILP